MTDLISSSRPSQANFGQEVLLHRIANRIRQSLELQEILATTVTEVRTYLDTDRVMIYRFHADASGEVIAESIRGDRLPALLGLHFPADDIPLQKRELFLQTRQRSIVDVATEQIGTSPLDCLDTEECLAAPEIQYRAADPCHVQYLKAMGVQSSLVLPILQRNLQAAEPSLLLWGLLVSHHAEPHPVTDADLQLVQRVVDQVSIAIAQATLLAQAQAQAQRETILNQIAQLIYALPHNQLQTALEQTVAALGGTGGRLYIAPTPFQPTPELWMCGDQPASSPEAPPTWLEQHSCWQRWLSLQAASPLYSIANLYETPGFETILATFQPTQISSVLILPLQVGQAVLGCLTIFRNKVKTEKVWAGPVDRAAQLLRQPRLSFAAWKEVKQDQVCPWTDSDRELAQALGEQFSRGIHQRHLYEQVQALNTNLEQQVEARTAQLQQSWKLDRSLKQITNQIRRSLNLPTVLNTIVREVKMLLDTDRVVIYQFHQGWQGSVIVESINGNWTPLLGNIYPDECFPKGHAQLYQGGRIRAVDDVAHSELAPCHIQFLQDIQVQANLVVPIRIGVDLWGLLIAHQCRGTRKWQALEVDLLQQLADQAAIALQQAELYGQSQEAAEAATAQSQKLEHMLQELQHTQTQLVQTEKMSSLGQLVAGVAHEINNPINFIGGNLLYAQRYVQDLLGVVQLYQQHCPDAHLKVQEYLEEIDIDFIAEDLPKLLSSMRTGTERIGQIILSLRNFSRLDEAEMKPVDIHEGIDNTLMILQHRLKAVGDHSAIRVVKDYAQLPLVECYAGQLNQVFMNILSNAIDALDEYNEKKRAQGLAKHSGQITIHTSLAEAQAGVVPHALIRIADNGPGIPDAAKAKIFDPFFTTKPIGKGTGLGLSISYQVVEKHGGILQCHSEPGQGTEFLIGIPLQHKTSAP